MNVIMDGPVAVRLAEDHRLLLRKVIDWNLRNILIQKIWGELMKLLPPDAMQVI